MENQQKQIQIKAKDEDIKGVYSNAMQVTHTQNEFVLDFLSLLGQEGMLSARIITSPAHLKRIVQALTENMEKYEQRFGVVTPLETPQSDIGFKPEKSHG